MRNANSRNPSPTYNHVCFASPLSNLVLLRHRLRSTWRRVFRSAQFRRPRCHAARPYAPDFSQRLQQSQHAGRPPPPHWRDAHIEHHLKLQDGTSPSSNATPEKLPLRISEKAQMNRQPFDSRHFGFDFTIAECTERKHVSAPRKMALGLANISAARRSTGLKAA